MVVKAHYTLACKKFWNLFTLPSSHKLLGLESETHPTSSCFKCILLSLWWDSEDWEAIRRYHWLACEIQSHDSAQHTLLWLYPNRNMLLASCSCYHEHSTLFSLLWWLESPETVQINPLNWLFQVSQSPCHRSTLIRECNGRPTQLHQLSLLTVTTKWVSSLRILQLQSGGRVE